MARRIALWMGVGLLLLIGVAAATARIVHVADSSVRLERFRLESAPWLSVPDPAARMREITEFDGTFASRPLATYLHTIGGAAFLLLAPLQFIAPLRRRLVGLHRWSGRLLLGIGFVVGIEGMYFGVLMPFTGPPESVVVALVGALFLFSLGRAFLAIRSGDVERHREWMIRAFASAIAISTVRVVGGMLDGTLTPLGYSVRQILGLSLWLGWIVTLTAAEIWIRRSRYHLETRIA